MLNKKLLLFIIAFALSFGNLLSQGGSNYSMFGIGDLGLNNGSYYIGLGGTSIAVKTEKQINILNPAMPALLKTTRLQTGYQFNQNYVSSDLSSLFQNNGKVSGIQAVFALDTSKDIAISFGISPYSNVNYYISNPLKTIKGTEEFEGRANYLGSGGLSIGQLGIAARLYDGFYLGLSGNYKFGMIKTINTVTIYDEYANYSTSQKTNRLSGGGIRGGIFYEPISNLGIGLYYDHSFNMINDLEYSFGSELIKDTVFSTTGELQLPSAFGLGLSYKSGKFLFAGDFIMQDFTDFTFNKTSKFTYQPFTQMSFGISRIGSEAYSATFLDRISYNIGFGYKNQYFKLGDNQINDYYFTFGMEMPIVGNALINTAFVFGQRGTTKNGLVKETYGKLVIDFSIGETWFKPFIREY